MSVANGASRTRQNFQKVISTHTVYMKRCSGRSLDLKTVASLIEPEHLELMKAQNGGLQTLLRNQHQTFQVTKGRVQLRWLPERMASSVHNEAGEVEPKRKKAAAEKMKTRLCWMLQNHPDGCPYPSFLCDFAHFEGPGQ
ncbi:hypothetical protein T265_00621 [Opisthorchis viverrini]|uniref:Uncharacterized protein n=1 Tax=Opisthorchis viverrini TaxID=6198 RepID=A0A075A2B1_OPIVI|nr:hypothetical protein T265_00621 [Opisthorchis viverrini]KER33506.1 hypothetical protein T265_00621 [Opisthorchis viverrini]